MEFGKIPLFSALLERMNWLAARQRVLSENIANADTPGYQPRDLKPLNFKSFLHESEPSAPTPAGPLAMAVTAPNDIVPASAQGGFALQQPNPDAETSPTGNGVVVENQMMKLAETQIDYAAASKLYTAQVKMINTAIGTP